MTGGRSGKPGTCSGTSSAGGQNWRNTWKASSTVGVGNRCIPLSTNQTTSSTSSTPTAFAPSHSTTTLLGGQMSAPANGSPLEPSPSNGSSLSRKLSLSASPALDSLTLAHILNGETCPPIAFGDFAAFVSHKEFTTENLLFVIWFRSYRYRWNQFPRNERERIPIPSARMGDRYAPFAYLDKKTEDGIVGRSRRDRDSLDGSLKVEFESSTSIPIKKKEGCRDTEGVPKKSWFSRRKSPIQEEEAGPSSTIPTLSPILNPTSEYPPLPPPGTVLMPISEQPLRAEAERAFQTFMKAGGTRELGISDELRVFAKDTLARSTHPNCFLPIYEEIYHTVESQSLPAFLAQAKMNINRPKQLYWYIVGLIDFLIGTAFFLLLTLLLPERNFGYRLTRLPCIIFTSFGAMQFYSALRGFCSQVWGRASRQVQPWELDSVVDGDGGDEESGMRGREMSEVEGMPLRSLSISGASGLGLGINGESKIEVGLKSQSSGMEELDLSLPEGVFPLGELVGIDINQLPTEPKFDIPLTRIRSDSTENIEMEDEMSEIQRRQLAIRRSTIKVPTPNLAFPISSSDHDPISPISPLTPNSAQPFLSSNSHTLFDNEISPFSPISPISPPHKSKTQAPLPTPISGMKRRPVLSQHRIHQPDLSTLLVNFRRSEPLDPNSYKENEGKREKAIRVFGAERVIEDPRIKELMSRIVKEILIVGVVVGVGTVILCFAIPMRLGAGA